jgi:sulfatase modifying factor 1
VEFNVRRKTDALSGVNAWRHGGVTKLISILVAVLAVAGLVFSQDAPKEPPNKDGQNELETSKELAERIAKLIAQLGDDDFSRRESAQEELIKIGRPVLAAVRKALKDSGDAEVKERAAKIVEKVSNPVFTPIGKNKQGYEEYRHEKTGMVFVRIPGGTFKMGSENGNDDERPVHEVKINGFYISKHEVTQAAWRKVMAKSPSRFTGEANPVESVSGNDCAIFCSMADVRLPTEAEWEYACRAGTNTEYYWGDRPDGAYVWNNENSAKTTHPAGQKKPNGFGLYDMSGNVWELCQDLYGSDYYASSPNDNPKGPESGKSHVLRGGCWGSSAAYCRSAVRHRQFNEADMDPRNIYGLRVVIDDK